MSRVGETSNATSAVATESHRLRQGMLDAMKWMTTVVMAVLLACSSKAEKEPEEDKSLSSKLGGLMDKAKEVGTDVGGKAKEIGGDAIDKAKEVGSDVADRAKDLEIEKHAREVGDEVARRAEGLSKDALSLGKDLKAKLATGSKLAKYNYDLSIDATPESEDDFKKRHAKLKAIDVGEYKVGFERRSAHPLGKVYKWQFLIGWRLPDGRSVRLSLYTDDELEELLLAAMMGELLPIANLMFK
jgi:ribosomal protein L18